MERKKCGMCQSAEMHMTSVDSLTKTAVTNCHQRHSRCDILTHAIY